MSHNWKLVEGNWNVVEDRANMGWECKKCGSKSEYKRYRDAVTYLPGDIRNLVIQTIDKQAGVKMYSCDEIIALRVMVA
jgi:hypothetical protein